MTRRAGKANIESLRPALVLAALACIASPVLRAQASSSHNSAATPVSTAPLVFEVATIRPSKTQQYNGVRFTPDGASAVGISLQNLIRSAYNQWHDELWSGGPSWIGSDYYNLEARFDPAVIANATDEQRRAMLQALLADRFKLTVRREPKALPHYALVVLKGGPKLQETKTSDLKPDEDHRIYCRAGLSTFRQCTMAEFANVVSGFGLNAPVEDRTGLTARYDFMLRWGPPSTVPPAADAAPDIFTALQEQLGLKLEPIKGPVDTFVIDHVEKPSED